MSAPDFVAIGHVTLDRFGDTIRPGGAALYAAITAHRLGLSVGLLTSHGEDFALDLLPPQIEVVSIPSRETTVFQHGSDGTARSLGVEAAAGPITLADVPEDWTDPGIVLLAPVVNEVDPLIATAFPGSAVAAAAQGYLRSVGTDGRVVPSRWQAPSLLLGRIQALFLSREDVADDVSAAIEWFQRVPIGALTAGRKGADLFVNGEGYFVRPRAADEVDETGAGDVFAAAFMVHYQRDGDAWQAAAAAACAGAASVTGVGWSAVPDRATLASILTEYDRDE